MLEFHQSPWLSKYIDLNTKLRKKAENDFEKDFFKLMNNSVFGKFELLRILYYSDINYYELFKGKTMENVRKRLEMKLVSNHRKIQKLINMPNFKYVVSYNENLSIVSMDKRIIEFNKPMYIGFAVLDLSKTLMYDYHYNVMKRHYNDSITLMYTDTGKMYITFYINMIY